MTAFARARAPLRALVAALLIVVASVTVAALLAPAFAAVLSAIKDEPVSVAQVLLRTLQVVTLLLTLAIALALAPSRAGAFGLQLRPRWFRRFFAGVGLGSLSLVVVVAVLFALEVRVVRYDLNVQPAYWLGVVGKALLAAAVIALIEEVWFRGSLLSLLQQLGGAAVAIVVTSALYAASHFLALDETVSNTAGSLSGMGLLLDSLEHVFALRNLDSMLVLLLGGLWLGLVRLIHGDIAACIGIHLGWVLVIKVFKKYTYIDPHSEYRWMAGRYDDLIGWVASVVFAIACMHAFWQVRKRLHPQRL